MEIEIIENKETKIALIKSKAIIIYETQDALDLMADVSYLGARKIILNENQLTEDFFNLKSGIAGEILQKFSTYNVDLAIIGDFSKFESKSLRDFIFESNRHGSINFVSNIDEAKERLSNK